MRNFLISLILFFAGTAIAGDLGIADVTKADIERFTGSRSGFDALCGTAEREQKCTVEFLGGRLIVNGAASIPFPSIFDVSFSRGGDDPGPIGHRIWGRGYDQTAVFYKDSSGRPALAIFAFRHAGTWMHFNLNLISAKNKVAFD
jgi:hypothetical protein